VAFIDPLLYGSTLLVVSHLFLLWVSILLLFISCCTDKETNIKKLIHLSQVLQWRNGWSEVWTHAVRLQVTALKLTLSHCYFWPVSSLKPRADSGLSWFSLDGPLVKSKGRALFCFQAEFSGWSGLKFLKDRVKVSGLYLPGNNEVAELQQKGWLSLVLNKRRHFKQL